MAVHTMRMQKMYGCKHDCDFMFVKDITELDEVSQVSIGGKGKALGEMKKMGMLVPDGFVIFSDAYERFLKETGNDVKITEILQAFYREKNACIDEISKAIQDLILNEKIPQSISYEIEDGFRKLQCAHVAVRSSATVEDSAEHAWAGQLESFLNTTEEKLLENIKKCWASLFSPRSIFYCRERGLQLSQISVAVIIQKMIKSEKSGIAFSVHPVTHNPDHIVIEMGFGLGELIVNGRVIPCRYVIDKFSKKIIEKNHEKQHVKMCCGENGGNRIVHVSDGHNLTDILDKKEICDLIEIILQIENFYGFPCDIEWAYENGDFYIIQSRPITIKNEDCPTSFNERRERKNLIDYIASKKWGNYDNKGMDLLIRSLQIRGFRKMQEYTDQKMKAEDIVVDFGKAVQLKMYSLESFFTPNFTQSLLNDPKRILEYITRSHASLKRAKKMIGMIQEMMKNGDIEGVTKKTKKLLEEFLEVSYWKYYLTAISVCIYKKKISDTDVNESLLKRLQEWKNDERFYGFEGEILIEVAHFLSQKRNLSVQGWEISKYIHIDEFFDLLEGDISQKYIRELIKKRKKIGYVSLNLDYAEHENKTMCNSEQEAQKVKRYVIKTFKMEHEKSIKENLVYGTVVQRSLLNIKSECVVVKDYQELKGMTDLAGKILITTMSTPKYMPYIKNVKAIVTDTGGMMCHAAITAREMQIPCIVGTKVGTTFFHTGNIVEINFTNGSIKKFCKND